MNSNTEYQTRFAASLNCLARMLIAKGFTFVTPEASPEHMNAQLAKFDEGRLWLGGKVFSLLLGGADLPEFAQTITKHVVAFGAEQVDDAELAALQQLMRSCFPLCAFAFSKLYGPRFVALINGDNLTQAELCELMDQFQQVNFCMMGLGGRLSLKLFGKSILGINGSAATGSLFIVTSTTERANRLHQWVHDQPLHSDTMINQMKESLTRWQFWAKAAFGMIEYKPHQLRQEAIVLNTQLGQAVSSASPRLAFEFGFSLEDLPHH